MSEKDLKKEIIKKYIKLVKKNRLIPGRRDLAEVGVSVDQYRRQFTTLDNLKNEAKKAFPEAFKSVVDDSIFTPKNFQKVKDQVGLYDKFVVTTAVTGMAVHDKFYKNLKYYCEVNNAKLLIIPTTDPASKGFNLDSALADESIVFGEIELNKNIVISNIRTSAKQINPLTGLKRVGRRERSIIVSSPKQFLEHVPISNADGSHAMMTTGAITVPQYLDTDRYMSLRTAYIADFDHKMGAVIVEIEDESKFHFRHIQAEYDTGNFVDLGIYYQKTKHTTVRPEALVLGDIHVGHGDPLVDDATDQILMDLKPKRVFLHDLFDGSSSVNPHTQNSYLSNAKKTVQQLSLEEELKMVKNWLEDMKGKHPYVQEWVVVRSNHDLFIERWLEVGTYIQDPVNSRIGHKLAIEVLEGKMALEAGLRIVGANLKGITFLRISDSYKIKGIEHGSHGHIGASGSRNPSNAGLENAYGSGTFGHSHCGGILRDIFRVGHMSAARHGYNVGASAWTVSCSPTYSNGSRQLINVIEGKYRPNGEKTK